MYGKPSSSSWCYPASFKFIIAMSNKSANCSRSFAFPGLTCLNIQDFHINCSLLAFTPPPFFRSRCSFAALDGVAEYRPSPVLPQPGIIVTETTYIATTTSCKGDVEISQECCFPVLVSPFVPEIFGYLHTQ